MRTVEIKSSRNHECFLYIGDEAPQGRSHFSHAPTTCNLSDLSDLKFAPLDVPSFLEAPTVKKIVEPIVCESCPMTDETTNICVPHIEQQNSSSMIESTFHVQGVPASDSQFGILTFTEGFPKHISRAKLYMYLANSNGAGGFSVSTGTINPEMDSSFSSVPQTLLCGGRFQPHQGWLCVELDAEKLAQEIASNGAKPLTLILHSRACTETKIASSKSTNRPYLKISTIEDTIWPEILKFPWSKASSVKLSSSSSSSSWERVHQISSAGNETASHSLDLSVGGVPLPSMALFEFDELPYNIDWIESASLKYNRGVGGTGAFQVDSWSPNKSNGVEFGQTISRGRFSICKADDPSDTVRRSIELDSDLFRQSCLPDSKNNRSLVRLAFVSHTSSEVIISRCRLIVRLNRDAIAQHKQQCSEQSKWYPTCSTLYLHPEGSSEGTSRFRRSTPVTNRSNKLNSDPSLTFIVRGSSSGRNREEALVCFDIGPQPLPDEASIVLQLHKIKAETNDFQVYSCSKGTYLNDGKITENERKGIEIPLDYEKVVDEKRRCNGKIHACISSSSKQASLLGGMASVSPPRLVCTALGTGQNGEDTPRVSIYEAHSIIECQRSSRGISLSHRNPKHISHGTPASIVPLSNSSQSLSTSNTTLALKYLPLQASKAIFMSFNQVPIDSIESATLSFYLAKLPATLLEDCVFVKLAVLQRQGPEHDYYSMGSQLGVGSFFAELQLSDFNDTNMYGSNWCNIDLDVKKLLEISTHQTLRPNSSRERTIDICIFLHTTSTVKTMVESDSTRHPVRLTLRLSSRNSLRQYHSTPSTKAGEGSSNSNTFPQPLPPPPQLSVPQSSTSPSSRNLAVISHVLKVCGVPAQERSVCYLAFSQLPPPKSIKSVTLSLYKLKDPHSAGGFVISGLESLWYRAALTSTNRPNRSQLLGKYRMHPNDSEAGRIYIPLNVKAFFEHIKSLAFNQQGCPKPVRKGNGYVLIEKRTPQPGVPSVCDKASNYTTMTPDPQYQLSCALEIHSNVCTEVTFHSSLLDHPPILHITLKHNPATPTSPRRVVVGRSHGTLVSAKGVDNDTSGLTYNLPHKRQGANRHSPSSPFTFPSVSSPPLSSSSTTLGSGLASLSSSSSSSLSKLSPTSSLPFSSSSSSSSSSPSSTSSLSSAAAHQ